MTCNHLGRLVIIILALIFVASSFSHLPVGSVKAGLPSVITTSLSLSATINGHSFTGSGTGEAYPQEGRMVTTIVFSSFPGDYHPYAYGKTWKCKRCHKCFAKESYGGMNLFTLTQGNFDTDMTKTYSNGAEGTLTISAQIRMVNATHSHTTASIAGEYVGSVDAVDVLASHPTLYPVGSGRITAQDTETIVISDGSSITLSTYEEISFINTTATMPFVQKVSITPIKLSWTPGNLTLKEETMVTVYPEDGVGGFWASVDKLALLAPYVGAISTIIVVTVAIAICVKRVNCRQEVAS